MHKKTFGQLGDSRDNNFDFLRFLMASMVVFAHSFAFVHGETYYGADPLNRWTRWQIGFGDLAVAGFFLISGYLVTRSWMFSKGIGDFAKKRALRIIPGLVVALLFIVFIVGPLATTDRSAYFRSSQTYRYLGLMFCHDFKTSDRLPGVFVHNPWPYQLDSSLWTIRFEVMCYCIVALLGILKVYRQRGIVLGMGALCYAGFVMNMTGHLHNGTLRAFTFTFTYFFAGMLLYLYRESILYSSRIMQLCVVALIGASFIHAMGILMPFCGGYLLFYCALNRSLKLQHFARHGDLSYGVYIYAFPIQQWLVYTTRNGLSPGALFILSLLIVSGLGALSWHFVEQPFLKLKSRKLVVEQAKPYSPDPPRAVYKTLDAWRGFASLWVVMYHMAIAMFRNYPSLHSMPIYAFPRIGHLGVELFFVISGFCIANAAVSSMRREHSASDFMMARLRRIYPPCWAALGLAAALALVTAALRHTGHLAGSTPVEEEILHRGPLYFLANFTLTGVFFRQPLLIVVCWTLTYELCFYVCVAMALMIQASLGGRSGVLHLLHGLTFLVMCVLLLAPGYRRFPLDLWPLFGLGILVYDLIQYPHEKRSKLWAGLIGLQFLLFVLCRNVLIGAWPEPSRVIFAVSFVFAGMIYLLHPADAALAGKRPVRILASIGLFSYSLYLTHVLSIGVFNQAVKILHLPQSTHPVIYILAVSFAVLAAWGFYGLFERPFTRSVSKRAPLPKLAEQKSS